ncbi:MAG: ribonuclease III [Prochlorotrichaceae cyanobacterium]|jgi:ribonuclease-3
MPSSPRQNQLERLVNKLGIAPSAKIKWDVMDRALCHPSAHAVQHYEHLEFLGDGVIRLAAAQFLTETYPDLPVGDLAAVRSVLVSDRTLADIAATYNLDRYILTADIGKRDELGVSRRLAEALEALLGALYLSTQDLSLIRSWLDYHFQELAQGVLADPARKNYKAALQEWTQAQAQSLPDYRVKEINTQPDADDRFEAEVWLENHLLGKGWGRSIKLAEQNAAQKAFLQLPPQR